MNKKYISILVFIILSIGGVLSYLSFLSQVSLLKDHYPIFSKESGSYILNSKKPKWWVSTNQVSREAKFAIVISEDWAFFDHNGIDLNQLKIVLKESFKEKELTRGASTITQQVVKNTFLSNERSIFRKLKEFLLARELEKILTKDEILEIYLNLIELGEDVYGISKGSHIYFKKKPYDLNAKEGAFLAMLLPSPIRYAESYRKKKLTDFARTRIEDILLKLKKIKIITDDKRQFYISKRLAFEEVEDNDFEFFEDEKEELEAVIDKELE